MNEPGTLHEVNKRPFSLGHLCLDPTQWVVPELRLLVIVWGQWV